MTSSRTVLWILPSAPPADHFVPEGADMDQNGNPLYPEPGSQASGHYVPLLTACVVDNMVAVIPGPAEVCAPLGIPALEK